VVEQDHSFLLKERISFGSALEVNKWLRVSMSLLLIKPEFDIWEPGEHTGTLGNQLAFVGGTALEYRENTNLEQEVKVKEFFLKFFLGNSTNQ